MSTRRHQKGRKHRTVNRTPRPVAPVRADTAAAPTPAEPATAPGPAAPSPTAVAASVPGPAAPPVTTSSAVPSPTAVAAPAVPHPAAPRPEESGIARTALKTLQQLRAAGSDGTTIDALSATVGYQPATIARHIDSLAAHHLVHQRDGRWYA
ncbi:helix-turn-helix domain-containing protein, partial [Actinacidiphila sp. bgisy167]|uniref:helix-turn-helix domain-containing protein n=1 Tax=Actinacidiphila sp. bgisy167 TaxID=3413797 RepID=UPI003D75F0BC